MSKTINKCLKDNSYTMKDNCPKCGEKVFEYKPAKYSPNDNYAHYKREAKKENYKKQGLI